MTKKMVSDKKYANLQTKKEKYFCFSLNKFSNHAFSFDGFLETRSLMKI